MRIEHALKVVRARGLPLGAGEGAHLDTAGGVIVRGIGQQAERAAHVVHEQAGHGTARVTAHLVIDFGNIGDGARLDGAQQVLALERGALAHEQRARAGHAGVIGRE